MKNWESTKIDIGTVKPYQRTYVTFKCLDKVKMNLLIELNKIDRQYESKNKS